MASFTISATSSTQQTLLGSESGGVTANGSLATTGQAVTIQHASTANLSTLTALGAIHSATDSAIGSSGTNGTVTMNVGMQGSLTSGASNLAVVDLAIAGTFSINNAGLISGGQAIRVSGSSGTQTATLANTGTILSGGVSVGSTVASTSSVENLTVLNDGTIAQSAPSFRAINHDASGGVMIVANTGTIMALGTAIRTSGRLDLANSGTIQGSVDFVLSAIIGNTGLIDGNVTDVSIGGLDDETSTVDNAGRITGTVALGTGDDMLRNFGTIDGSVNLGLGENSLLNLGGTIGGSVIFSSNNDVIRNRGTIEGNVTLGDGANIFDGRGGTVFGAVFGGDGADVFRIDRSDVLINALGGIDRVESSASYRVGNGVEVLQLTGDQGLAGTGRNGNETITGGAGNDTIEGRRGDDVLNGGEGDDRINGGGGNDTLQLSDGEDSIDGGAGLDTISTGGLGFGARVDLSANRATVTDASGDTLISARLSSVENVTGSAFADLIIGNGGGNRLSGGSGDDTIQGGGGGDDIEGSAGRDTLTGESGPDAFIFTSVLDSAAGAADLITDFAANADAIDLSAIDADAGAAGDQAFAFVGTSAFAGPAAQVRIVQDAGAGTTTVQVRLAGSAAVDMEIVLTGLVNLQASNFDL